jgi:hypothetical protein
VLVHIVRSLLFGFAAIFCGLTVMGAPLIGAVRGQF